MENKIWQEGSEAWFNQKPADDNPYEIESENYNLWHSGWKESNFFYLKIKKYFVDKKEFLK